MKICSKRKINSNPTVLPAVSRSTSVTWGLLPGEKICMLSSNRAVAIVSKNP